jgi:DNA-binding transcriptional LysR family regulator
MQRLEEQLGTDLFDQASYRPTSTEAGRVLLPRARLIADEMRALSDHAQGIAAGLKPELTLALDAMFPMRALLDALRTFGSRFPSMPPRFYVVCSSFGFIGSCRVTRQSQFGEVLFSKKAGRRDTTDNTT